MTRQSPPPNPSQQRPFRSLWLHLFSWLALIVLAPSSALAQDVWSGSDPLTSGLAAPLPVDEAFQFHTEAWPEGLHLQWDIAPGYYLYREHLAAELLDGTPLATESGPGVVKDDPIFGPTEIYLGSASLLVPATGAPIQVTWQGCQDEGLCYPPVTRTLQPDGTLASGPTSPGPSPEPTSGGLRLASGEGGLVSDLAGRGGTGLVLASFLGFGLLLAFTPCVLPMVPILLGLLSREGERLTPRRGALLAGIYVLAMASAFGLLGVAAALSGRNLQVALQSPWVLGGMALLFVSLALSSFGLLRLTLPAGLTGRISGLGLSRRGSLPGAAILGFTSALVVGPCVTAPLAGALLYIAQSGDVMLGAGALFALGLGQGLPMVVASTFGLRVLPRAGAWMERVNRLFGVLFLGMAVWLVGRVVPGPVGLALWAGFALTLGVALGAFDPLPPGARIRHRIGKAAALSGVVSGAIFAIGAAAGGSDPLRPMDRLQSALTVEASPAFQTARDPASLLTTLEQANTGQGSLIYVTADWCITCGAIERDVLTHSQVQAALDGLTLVKADVSDITDDAHALLNELGTMGPPTMIFLDASRGEPAGTRLVGDVTVEGLVRSAAEVR